MCGRVRPQSLRITSTCRGRGGHKHVCGAASISGAAALYEVTNFRYEVTDFRRRFLSRESHPARDESGARPQAVMTMSIDCHSGSRCRGYVLGQELERIVDGKAKLLGYLLHLLVSECRPKLINGDWKIFTIA